MSDTMIIV